MGVNTDNTNEDPILQDWNGFGFKYIEKTDYPKCLKSLQENFYRDEPIHQILGVTPQRIADMDQKITDILNLNHGSFFAYPLDQPDKIAAVMVIWIQEKGKELPPFEARSPLTALVRECIMLLKKRYSIHEQRGIDKYPELFIISTERSFRGKGLATQMYVKAISKFKSQGYPLVSSTFTNPVSRLVGKKLGFREVSRLDFDECQNEDGTSVFGESGKGHFVIETVLELE